MLKSCCGKQRRLRWLSCCACGVLRFRTAIGQGVGPEPPPSAAAMAQAQKRQRRIAEAFDFKLPRKILRRIESLLPDDACDALASASNATSDINVGATTTPFGKLLQKVRLPLESREEHEATCLHPAALLQRGFRCLYTKFCRVLKNAPPSEPQPWGSIAP